MYLYLLSQDENTDSGFVQSCIVASNSKLSAAKIHPCGQYEWNNNPRFYSWASKPENVKVEYLGQAKPSMKESILMVSYYSD